MCSVEAPVAAAEYVKSGRPIYGEPGDYTPWEVRSNQLRHTSSGSLFTGDVEGDKCDVTSRFSLIKCFHILGKEKR